MLIGHLGLPGLENPSIKRVQKFETGRIQNILVLSTSIFNQDIIQDIRNYQEHIGL